MSLLRAVLSRTPRTLYATRALSSLSPNLYTASSTSTGSRASGTSSTAEGNVDVKMGLPKEMGGTKGPLAQYANPEQLFGMAFSTCFLSALGASQGNLNPGLKPLPKSTSVRALVSIGKDPAEKIPGFLLGVELEVIRAPLKEAGLDEAGMEALLKAAHEMCPYSRATRGNIEVVVKLVDI